MRSFSENLGLRFKTYGFLSVLEPSEVRGGQAGR